MRGNIREHSPHDTNPAHRASNGGKVGSRTPPEEDDKSEDINTLTFVAIHEMGHLASESIGHKQEFWDNFEFLLKEAISIGLYEKVEYSKHPKSYCGIQITDSPVE